MAVSHPSPVTLRMLAPVFPGRQDPEGHRTAAGQAAAAPCRAGLDHAAPWRWPELTAPRALRIFWDSGCSICFLGNKLPRAGGVSPLEARVLTSEWSCQQSGLLRQPERRERPASSSSRCPSRSLACGCTTCLCGLWVAFCSDSVLQTPLSLPPRGHLSLDLGSPSLSPDELLFRLFALITSAKTFQIRSPPRVPEVRTRADLSGGHTVQPATRDI